MRLYQQIRASIARSALVGAGLVVFVSGLPLSAFGQAAQTQAPQTPPATPAASGPVQPVTPGTPITIEEAVKMALENNLGIQIEKLNPQIQVLGISRAVSAYAPTLFS